MTQAEFENACACRIDSWIPACDGTETPFTTRTGARLLYCYNPREGKHAYLRVDGDTILSDEEARAALALY